MTQFGNSRRLSVPANDYEMASAVLSPTPSHRLLLPWNLWLSSYTDRIITTYYENSNESTRKMKRNGLRLYIFMYHSTSNDEIEQQAELMTERKPTFRTV